MQCPITKIWGAGIAPRFFHAASTSTSYGRHSPHHCRCHTHFPAASQPFCSPSSIYLIINSAITINSWDCCSHVDQSSAVVRAEQGHVSSPRGLLSPRINGSRRVCCGCTGLWSAGTGGGVLSGFPAHGTGWHWYWELLTQGQNPPFCSVLQ